METPSKRTWPGFPRQAQWGWRPNHHAALKVKSRSSRKLNLQQPQAILNQSNCSKNVSKRSMKQSEVWAFLAQLLQFLLGLWLILRRCHLCRNRPASRLHMAAVSTFSAKAKASSRLQQDCNFSGFDELWCQIEGLNSSMSSWKSPPQRSTRSLPGGSLVN